MVMNGCKFTLTDEQTTNTYLVDIVGCTPGKQVQIIVSNGCTIDIPNRMAYPTLLPAMKGAKKSKPT